MRSRVLVLLSLLLLLTVAVVQAQDEEPGNPDNDVLTCDHPRVAYLADKTGAGCEAILTLHASGVGLGQIMKAAVVAEDEREQGRRALLNFGHTFGHAIENSVGYGEWLHGEAVAAGISVKLEVCRRMGLLSAEEARRAARIIEAYGLTMKRRPFDIEGIIGHMAYDKKNFGGSVNFVLLEGTGNPKINQRIPVEMLREVMAEVLC